MDGDSQKAKSNLPASWATARIDDICRRTKRVNPATLNRDNFAYIDIESVDNSSHLIAQPKKLPTSDAPSRARQVVSAGDTIFSNVRVYLENIAMVPDDLDGEIASTAFSVLGPCRGIDPRYLFHFVTSRPFLNRTTQLQRGNSPPSVSEEDVRNQRIPIAPTNEQRRIASKIDELFSQIDAGEANLRRVQALVKTYRQSILKAAVTGDLTRDWRDKNRGKDETGEALLKRILAAHRQAWEEAELAKLRAKGKKPKDDKWKAKYKEPVAPDTSDLPDLPEGWVWASPDALSSFQKHSLTIGPFGSNLKVSDYRASGVPLIFVRHIRAQNFKGLDPKFVELRKAEELSAHTVRPGDILITKMGDPPGDACVYPEGSPIAIITADCIKWRLSELLALPSFFAHFVTSSEGRRQFASITKGVAQQKVSLDRFRTIAVPVPPLAEQAQIVETLDVELTRIDHLNSALIEHVEGIGKFRQSILDSAFSGKLAPQSLTDEPAPDLLKRINTEREA